MSMKILFINLPYYGHVIPTIGFIQELIKQDIKVTTLMPFDWKEFMKQSGADFVGYQNHKQLSEQIKNCLKVAESIIQDYDLVIYEQFFFLGKHLAEKYNKPVVRIFTAPIANKKIMNEYIQKGPLSIFKFKWIAKTFTKDITKDYPLKTDNWLDEIIYNPPKLNLIYTLKEYQPYIEEYNEDNYKFIGPSIYERNETFNFNKTRPILYVSLGTIVKDKKFYQTIINAFKDEDIDIIISTKEKIKNVPSNIHIYERVPQIEVLKISDIFITHGGMNSISEAMVYQIPMIVIPFNSDQPVNARCVEKLKIGIQLDINNIHEIKDKVNYLINNKEIKENYSKVQEYINHAAGNAGAVQMIFDYYKKEKNND